MFLATFLFSRQLVRDAKKLGVTSRNFINRSRNSRKAKDPGIEKIKEISSVEIKEKAQAVLERADLGEMLKFVGDNQEYIEDFEKLKTKSGHTFYSKLIMTALKDVQEDKNIEELEEIIGWLELAQDGRESVSKTEELAKKMFEAIYAEGIETTTANAFVEDLLKLEKLDDGDELDINMPIYLIDGNKLNSKPLVNLYLERSLQNAKDVDAKNLVDFAIKVRDLKDLGANFNLQDSFGETILEQAVKSLNLEKLLILTAFGASNDGKFKEFLKRFKLENLEEFISGQLQDREIVSPQIVNELIMLVIGYKSKETIYEEIDDSIALEQVEAMCTDEYPDNIEKPSSYDNATRLFLEAKIKYILQSRNDENINTDYGELFKCAVEEIPVLLDILESKNIKADTLLGGLGYNMFHYSVMIHNHNPKFIKALIKECKKRGYDLGEIIGQKYSGAGVLNLAKWAASDSEIIEALQKEITNEDTEQSFSYTVEKNLPNGKVRFLPKEIGRLVNLQSLWVSNQDLREIPVEIGALKDLESINFSNNKLVGIPEELGELENLNSLSLGGNQLKDLPKTLNKLNRLKILRLNNNLLTGGEAVTKSLDKLLSLELLFLMENPLEELPDLKSLPKLKTLRLSPGKKYLYETEKWKLPDSCKVRYL